MRNENQGNDAPLVSILCNFFKISSIFSNCISLYFLCFCRKELTDISIKGYQSIVSQVILLTEPHEMPSNESKNNPLHVYIHLQGVMPYIATQQALAL